MRSCDVASKRNAKYQGPAVRRRISANPGLNFNPGFYISLFKSRYGIIFPIPFNAFNHSIVPNKNGIHSNFLLNLSDLKSNFTLTMVYLNPA